MFRKFVLPLVAAAGAGLAVWTAVMGARPVPAAAPVAEPSRAPFASYLAGAGLVEASSENIEASTPVPGLVAAVAARPGARLQAGAELFRLDDREPQAELAVRRAALDAARQKLARLQALPRPEDLPPAEARLRAAEAARDQAKDALERVEKMADRRAWSEEDLARRKFAAAEAEARVIELGGQLALLRAGAWGPDVEVAKAEVAAAAAQVRAAEVAVERLTVRAPVDAEVLQVDVRPGEYARAGDMLVLLGATDVLHVRVDVDENDAWRFKAGAAAVGFVRGNRELNTRMEFVRLEPFVVPKRSLTGSSSERVDTRVMQVIYRFERAALPVYVGQQMDVVIEAPAGGGR